MEGSMVNDSILPPSESIALVENFFEKELSRKYGLTKKGSYTGY
jgi:hypothetical protein